MFEQLDSRRPSCATDRRKPKVSPTSPSPTQALDIRALFSKSAKRKPSDVSATSSESAESGLSASLPPSRVKRAALCHSRQVSAASFQNESRVAQRLQPFCATPCSAHAHALPKLDFRTPDAITEADSQVETETCEGATLASPEQSIEVTFGCIDETMTKESLEGVTSTAASTSNPFEAAARDLADATVDFSREGLF